MIVTLFSIVALGFFLGMRHATDPDHVIAVTTIVSRQRDVRHAALVGVLWGVGHTVMILLGVLSLSGMMQWIPETLTPGRLSVGDHSHGHDHRHWNFRHSHAAERRSEGQDGRGDKVPIGRMGRIFRRLGVYQVVRPLAVGIVHGLAGSAAVALLVLTTIRIPAWAVVYLLVFGVGTIAGMMLITAAIAVPFQISANRFARLNRGLGLFSGLVSLGFGLFIVYQMGFANGLFSGNPVWHPR